MKILVVDDEPSLVKTVRGVLEARGHLVDEAFDGQEASECLERCVYDIVVTDHNMPELTGIELVKLIKDKCPQTIVIMLSGYENMSDFIAKKLGVDEYLWH